MPILLRSVKGDINLKVLSSNVLIGRLPTCDVSLDWPGIVDRHALVSVLPDGITQTLTPFAGAKCFVNSNLVPPQGHRIASGDQLSFGDLPNDLHTLLITFEEDPKSTNANLSRDLSSFRKAVDTIRGDRRSLGPIQFSNEQYRTNGLKSSEDKSYEMLKNRQSTDSHLHAASSDSRLAEYIERKLQQSSARLEQMDGNRLRTMPSALYPPPSLSSSLISNKSSHELTSPILSIAERNFAEAEKLRLSQRLREVNNVLNGDIAFASSSLRSVDGNKRTKQKFAYQSMEKISPNKSNTELIQTQDNYGEDSDDDDDELPMMVEKPSRQTRNAVSTLKQSKVPLVTKSNANLENGQTNLQRKQSALVSTDSLNTRAVDLVSSPLASNSKPTYKDSSAHISQNFDNLEELVPQTLFSTNDTLKSKDNEPGSIHELDTPVSPSALPTQHTSPQHMPSEVIQIKKKERTIIQQRVIDNFFRLKHLEYQSHAFERWRTNSRCKAHKRNVALEKCRNVQAQLCKLRRNQIFFRWKKYTSEVVQVIECRLGFYLLRKNSKSVKFHWTLWCNFVMKILMQKKQLQFLMLNLKLRYLSKGFFMWKHQFEGIRHKLQRENGLRQALEQCELELNALDNHWNERLEYIAEFFNKRHILKQRGNDVFRRWRKECNRKQQQRQFLLRSMFYSQYRVMRRGFWTLKQNMIYACQAELFKSRTANAIKAISSEEKLKAANERMILEDQITQHKQLFAKELEVATNKIKQLEAENLLLKVQIQSITNDFDNEKQKLTEEVASWKKKEMDQEQMLHLFNKSAIEKAHELIEELYKTTVNECDKRITQMSNQLNQLIQETDVDIESARFRSATLLIEHTINQKLRNANAQERILEQFTRLHSKCGFYHKQEIQETSLQLSPNALYLYEMIQQRQNRLNQLYQAIARIAAISDHENIQPDPIRLQYCTFLSTKLQERDGKHLVNIQNVLQQMTHFQSNAPIA